LADPPRRPLTRRSRRSPGDASVRRDVGRGVLVGVLADDPVDQVALAQAPESIDSELVGDRVKVCERTRFELGAIQYCWHLLS
jgi:hypothetical protein